jgi:hypothetical protein
MTRGGLNLGPMISTEPCELHSERSCGTREMDRLNHAQNCIAGARPRFETIRLCKRPRG